MSTETRAVGQDLEARRRRVAQSTQQVAPADLEAERAVQVGKLLSLAERHEIPKEDVVALYALLEPLHTLALTDAGYKAPSAEEIIAAYRGMGKNKAGAR